jgi:hypothetical protein
MTSPRQSPRQSPRLLQGGVSSAQPVWRQPVWKQPVWKQPVWKRWPSLPKESRRSALLFMVGLSLAGTMAACSGANTAAPGASSGANPGTNSGTAEAASVELTLVSYAVTQAAYEQRRAKKLSLTKATAGLALKLGLY